MIESVESEGNKMSAHYYYKYYAKKRPIGFKNFKTKYDKYFKQAAERFSNRKEFNAEKFIDAVILENGFIYPQQFCNERKWEDYLATKDVLIEDLSEIQQVAYDIVASAKELKGATVEEYLSKNRLKEIRILEGMQPFTLRLFSFSKFFNEYYEENEHLFDKQTNLSMLRAYVKQFPKIVKKIEIILGEDFYAL